MRLGRRSAHNAPLVQKSTSEVKELEANRLRREREKAASRAAQDANVKRKAEAKEQQRKEQKNRLHEIYGSQKKDKGDSSEKRRRPTAEDYDDADDDREYFRQEVGQEPDEELGTHFLLTSFSPLTALQGLSAAARSARAGRRTNTRTQSPRQGNTEPIATKARGRRPSRLPRLFAGPWPAGAPLGFAPRRHELPL